MILDYKRHLVKINRLKIVLEDEIKQLRKEYKSSTSKYDLIRLGNAGKNKKERLDLIVKPLKDCNGLLSVWDTVTNDELRKIIRYGKSI